MYEFGQFTSIASRAALLLGAALAFNPGAWAQQRTVSLKDQVIGTWSLVDQWVEQEGRTTRRFGASPKGITIYDGSGHAAFILLRSDLSKFTSNNAMTGTPEENKAVVQGSTAFFGKWSVDEVEGSLTIHIDGSTYPNWTGDVQKRSVAISGDQIRMCSPVAQIGGAACAIWKRVN